LSGLWPSEAQATSGEALQGRLRLLGPLRFGDARGELFEHRSLPPSPCSPALRRPATPRAGSSNRVLALKHDAGSSDVAWDWRAGCLNVACPVREGVRDARWHQLE